MHAAWPGDPHNPPGGDGMGPTVAREESARPGSPPPLKNGTDIRESGYLISVGSRTARFRRKNCSKIYTIVLLALLLVLFCLAVIMTVLYAKQKRHKPPPLCESRECLRSAANLALSMDLTANPCEDFYQYACGNWAEEHPRPDSYSSYDWFRDKQRRVYSVIRDFLSKNLTQQPRPVLYAKDMYDACMDIATLNKRGVQPIVQILETIGLPRYPTYINVTDFDDSTYKFDWVEAVIKVKTKLGMDVLIGFDIFTDPRNSSIYRLVMGSPETTNPFPSMKIERRRHLRRKTSILPPNIDPSIISTITERQAPNKSTKHDDEDEEKNIQILKLYYADLLKIFVIDSGDAKDSKLSETELDQNIISSANEYYSVSNYMYELETSNDTDSNEDLYTGIPEYTVDELQSYTDQGVEANNGTPVAIWKRYLQGIFSISDVELNFDEDKILVSELDLKYMALMASYIAETPPVVIELYIWIKVVQVMVVHTTSEMRAMFDRSYQQRHESSETASPPRSLQCATAVNDMLGMAVAYAIADPHFVNGTKPKVEIMLYEMKNALARLVGKAKWMDDDTKLATYEKIIKMKTLIGFPDWLLEESSLEEYYSGIEIDPHKHLENMVNVIQVGVKKGLNKFRKGNNYTWASDPTEVNAYHTFQENTITVPLVMLQYPFFDLGLDSLNYGSLGSVLGHEITHGFDNFGRQFDKNGNLLPWWTNDTVESFVNATQCFIDQYSTYYVPELDEHVSIVGVLQKASIKVHPPLNNMLAFYAASVKSQVNGKQTLGENIADNGGLREALQALKHHLLKYGPERKLPGFEHMSSEQLFFLSFGNLWCGISTLDSLRGDLDDEHAPQHLRARGALENSEDFARAFHCKPGTPMNPPRTRRCVIF